MRQYWQSLQPREQRILLFGAVFVLLAGLYALVWDPYQQGLHRLEVSVTQLQSDVGFMRQAAAEIQRLRGSQLVHGAAAGQSILALVDQTAKAAGLGSALKRIQPDGDHTAKVWLEQASFDDVLAWLDRLASQGDVKVSGMVVERQSTTGRVNIRLVLEGAQ